MGQLALAPGVRVTRSGDLDRPVVDRWLQAEWRVRPAWTLQGSAGVVHQLPDADPLQAVVPAGITLRPERALHLDLGIRRQLANAVSWSATLFARAERDLLPSLDGSGADGLSVLENRLHGLARGLELSLERHAAAGPGGRVGYAFGVARYTDPLRHETFWADFDRRHTLNVAAHYRLRTGASLGATYRAGSSVPIPGYFTLVDGVLHKGPFRNRIRLPAYSRLDVKAEQVLARRGREFTLFAEVINALDHRNVGLASGVISAAGEAKGFTQALYPRLLSGGIRVEF
jgi:hypothetical protein